MPENYDSIGKRISTLYRYTQIYLNQELQRFDLDRSQTPFLANLLKNDGLKQKELAAKLNVNKSTVAKAIKGLEEKDYIVKKQCAEDKRSARIYVTEKAVTIKAEFFAVLKKWTEVLTNNFSSEEEVEIRRLLDKMEANICTYMEEKNEV
ncbi:MarR family winged helix-turn-helix transcriptional regulator [Fuchsiella alkaliacetigena]|uniref:MarR family winged helix-turn-helix transcriptional regulator n=1 Tax=Fuchsiella alkaliacetigena TaxID=957042 RepID=UPI002009E71F|nr:MarR family transcriptional regulator [Fuchsiella alkaliacetigena]MCK8823837.1 MarR family transcriptional regulator [Fuchsiella alkaliacetigena]